MSCGKSRKGTWSVAFKALIVLAAVAGILLQCEAGTARFSLTSFRMFTTLSNLAVAAYFTVHLGVSSTGTRISEQRLRALRYFKFLITLSIMLTGLVAHFMLQGLFDNMEPMQKAGLTLLHYVVPIATVLDWLLFDEKGRTERAMPLFAALFPIVYATVTLVASPLLPAASRYPYPFLNVDALGAAAVALNIVLLAAAFLAVGFCGVWIDHRLIKRTGD